jgi:hypothetical protein
MRPWLTDIAAALLLIATITAVMAVLAAFVN